MICPTCNGSLSNITIEGIELDVCKDGCGGIWFDRFELHKMDEPHEFTDENLVDLLAAESKVDPDKTKRLNCPKCKDVVMMRNFFTVKREVEVDHCPKCGGYWLDEGELFHIRKQFKTEEERKQAATGYFGVIFDDELAKMKAESQEKAEQAKRIANMFKLISPRYYYSKLKNW
jgi:Zn-finger nucleic acid-binding protein